MVGLVIKQKVSQISAHIPVAVADFTQAKVDQNDRDGTVEAVAVPGHIVEHELDGR